MSVADILAGLQVEIGFGVDAVGGNYFVLNDLRRGKLNDVTYLLAPDTVFVDVTANVASVQTKRGRDRELDEYTTGIASIVLNDDDRTFDPSYASSPYFGQITPMRRVVVSWFEATLFTGWIDDVSITYETGDTLSRITIDCVDGFAILANQQLAPVAAAYGGDMSGERIERVLDLTDVDYPASRAIDTGLAILGDTTFDDNVLAYLKACARAEAGYLFVAVDGTLTFLDRVSTLNQTAALTLSDDRTAGVPYRTITQRSAADQLFTRVTGQSETTSTALEADDLAAQDAYLIRTLDLGTLLTADDTQTQALIDHTLERFSSVDLRFHTATVNLAACTEGEVRSVARLDLTDAVMVQRTPLGIGATISRLSLIDGISHRISNGSWTVDLAFATAETEAFFTLDSFTLGVLDTNLLAF